MKYEPYVTQYLQDLRDILAQLDTQKIALAIEWMEEARDHGRMVYSCGNGGSAYIASQMVTDIVKGGSYGKEARFKMIGLNDNFGTVTAYANDVSYESVFVEQLRNFAQRDDVLIAVSGSGNSPNVLRAVEYANECGCRTIGMTTGEGGRLQEIAQLPLVVPSGHMGRLEDSFFIMTHLLCYAFIE